MKNKKGFMSISIVYSFLILFLLLMFSIIVSYSNRVNMISSLVGESKVILKGLKNSNIQSFSYTGEVQIFTAPVSGNYKIELWGAQAGGPVGYGGFTSGQIYIDKNENYYIYVGGKGVDTDTTAIGGYNGGGNSTKTASNKSGYTGGGATDIRLSSGNWDDANSLKSRIMVAGGGGGSFNSNPGYSGGSGNAGGLEGYDGAYETSYALYVGLGGSQIKGGNAPSLHSCAVSNGTAGQFGKGGQGGENGAAATIGGGGGGGAGYYGGSGSSGLCNGRWSGGGGSSFISGHNGCDAIDSAGLHTGQPNHYSGKVFTNTEMIDGAGYKWTNVKGSLEQMPNPFGEFYSSGQGHTGNGFARITLLD